MQLFKKQGAALKIKDRPIAIDAFIGRYKEGICQCVNEQIAWIYELSQSLQSANHKDLNHEC